MTKSTNLRIVVMGVAGSGKSTVAARLAEALGARLVEADDHHLTASITKMTAGTPLCDDDRWPWLVRLQRELAAPGPVVLSCSALRRSYRDLLRRVGAVRFAFLDLDAESARSRVAGRAGHFMGEAMVESQFAALERPDDEDGVLVLDATADPASAVARIVGWVSASPVVSGPLPVVADGGRDRVITTDELRSHIVAVARDRILGVGARRVLLVPPDHTRLHSRAGPITAMLYEHLRNEGCEVGVLPALGTHAAMTGDDARLLFGAMIPHEALIDHQWRSGLVRVGEVGGEELSELSAGRFTVPIPIEIDSQLLDDWDLVVSVGQVVPHEVIGMANFTKNLVIGLGGGETVHRSHYLGAISDMERIMGRADGPVRHVVDAAFDRFVASRVRVLWVLTVMEDVDTDVVQRGLFVGEGRSSETGGAAYRSAAALAAQCNVTLVDEPFQRVACWLDPEEFRSTWLGNKAVYRTRMAIADGGELIVLAPGVSVFGEDAGIDALIRAHGYRGTPDVLGAVALGGELSANLGAAAHLIHGSSEGRFRIVYCTDPKRGGLTSDEVESVGFEWRSLPDELVRLGVDGSTPSGPRTDAESIPFHHIANPALGLWATAARFADS